MKSNLAAALQDLGLRATYEIEAGYTPADSETPLETVERAEAILGIHDQVEPEGADHAGE